MMMTKNYVCTWEVEPSWVVGVGELRGDRWVGEAEGENLRGNNNLLSESFESLCNGMGFSRFKIWWVCGVLAGVSMVNCGLNHWSRCAEDGGGGELEANLCFPVHECHRRPPGAENAKIHPGWGQGRWGPPSFWRLAIWTLWGDQYMLEESIEWDGMRGWTYAKHGTWIMTWVVGLGKFLLHLLPYRFSFLCLHLAQIFHPPLYYPTITLRLSLCLLHAPVLALQLHWCSLWTMVPAHNLQNVNAAPKLK